jgi:chemotaxis protein methyltransferase CheR
VSVNAATNTGSGAGDVERLEIELLLDALARYHGYDFRNYAPASLTRRIRAAARNESVSSISELQHKVLHDADALGRLVRAVSIHVTAMFRDADFYQVFRKIVVPQLRTYPFIRLWIAGCSTGEEVYSLAILLHEAQLYDRCRIYATDMSDDLLERARRGIYPADMIRRYTDAYHKAGGTEDFSRYYVSDSEGAIIASPLRKNIVFSMHNLASDASFNEFHVITCRNVLIYFDTQLRDRVLELLYGSLVRFGYLAVGKKERLELTTIGARFAMLPGDARIYRRIV